MKLLQNTAIARVFKTLFLVSMLPLSAATQAETQNPKSNQYWWPDQLDLSSLLLCSQCLLLSTAATLSDEVLLYYRFSLSHRYLV